MQGGLLLSTLSTAQYGRWPTAQYVGCLLPSMQAGYCLVDRLPTAYQAHFLLPSRQGCLLPSQQAAYCLLCRLPTAQYVYCLVGRLHTAQQEDCLLVCPRKSFQRLMMLQDLALDELPRKEPRQETGKSMDLAPKKLQIDSNNVRKCWGHQNQMRGCHRIICHIYKMNINMLQIQPKYCQIKDGDRLKIIMHPTVHWMKDNFVLGQI